MRNSLLFLVGILLTVGLHAQDFQPTFRRISGSKPGYLILNDGKRVDFTVKKIKRKKGLIKWAKLRSLDGKDKFKYRASEIKEFVVVPSLFSKLGALDDARESALQLDRTDFTAFDKLAHYYSEKIPNRSRTGLFQVVNPGFDSRIRVYGDPRSKETSGVSAGGMRLTGGLNKSYYVKCDGQFVKLRKNAYNRWFKDHFSACPAITTKYRNSAWRDFADHTYLHAKNCQ